MITRYPPPVTHLQKCCMNYLFNSPHLTLLQAISHGFLMDIKKSFIPFVISGTHQHNYNHVALGSPTRTPKNGKIMRWGGK